MPSRKQRRRREKSFRHEAEWVDIDEEGNEVQVEPDRLRAEREDSRPVVKATAGKSKGSAGKSARPLREPPVPTWRRAAKRGGLMGAVILLAFIFVLKGGSEQQRVLIAVIYGIAFIPLTYYVDRFAYRSYLRRLARGEGNAGGKTKAKKS